MDEMKVQSKLGRTLLSVALMKALKKKGIDVDINIERLNITLDDGGLAHAQIKADISGYITDLIEEFK